MIRLVMNREGEMFTGMVDKVHFNSVPLERVLNLLEEIVRATGDKDVLYCTKGVEVKMPAVDIELLLKDRMQLLRELAPPPIRIDLRPEEEKPESTLVIGYDTLANGFGDKVYCRRFGDTYECPGCSQRAKSGEACKNCGLPLALWHCNEKWVAVLTMELILSKRPKFFLPRGWNRNRPWISLEELENKFKAFTKEKANV